MPRMKLSPFDSDNASRTTVNAIAELELASGNTPPNLDDLRDSHPELAYLFNYIDAQADRIDARANRIDAQADRIDALEDELHETTFALSNYE